MNRRSFLTTLLGAVCGAAAAIYQPSRKPPEPLRGKPCDLTVFDDKSPFERMNEEFARELFYGSQDLSEAEEARFAPSDRIWP